MNESITNEQLAQWCEKMARSSHELVISDIAIEGIHKSADAEERIYIEIAKRLRNGL